MRVTAENKIQWDFDNGRLVGYTDRQSLVRTRNGEIFNTAEHVGRATIDYELLPLSEYRLPNYGLLEPAGMGLPETWSWRQTAMILAICGTGILIAIVVLAMKREAAV